MKSPPQQSIKKMIAMFDYNPNENSPNLNPDEELSFHSGDDGFFMGELVNGSKGLVPSNFLKEVSTMNADEHSFQQDSERASSNESKV